MIFTELSMLGTCIYIKYCAYMYMYSSTDQISVMYMYMYMCTIRSGTVYALIQAWASISFLVLETRLHNKTSVYLSSTVVTPGWMAHPVLCGTCTYFDNTAASLE